MPEHKPRTAQEKAAAGAIVLVRNATAEQMRGRARARVHEARSELGREPSRAKVLAVLAVAGRALAGDFADALTGGRARARGAARRRLAGELSSLGAPPGAVTLATRRRAADAVSAAVVGRSLAAQWRSLSAAAQAREGERDLWPATAAALAPRIERAAATEAARAYNDEHRAAAREFARAYPEEAARLQREWSAMLDACERCWPHDGERVDLGESFSGGDEPGGMHPRCMCAETIVAA